MKKLFFFIAALTLSFAAQAKVVECTPNTNAIAWWLTQGDTLVLADGEYSEAYSIDFDKPGVCVKAAEGAKPIIKLTGEWTALEVTATTTFDGITFDAGNVAQYIIATLDSTTFETDLTIKNCEFKNWNKWAISHYYQKNVSVNSIVIDNCLFHDAKNSAVYFSENAPEGKNACQDLKITNSTFYNIGDENAYTTVYCVGGNAVDAQKVTVDYCTFYNCQAKNTDHAAVRVTCAATISNTIIAAPASQGTYRAIHATDGSNAQAINCLTFNYTKDNGGIRSGATKTDCQLNVDPKFFDAANGNFALKDGSPALGAGTDGSNLGDPRWNAPAEEAKEPIELYADVTFTVDEYGDLNLVGEANTGEFIDIWVASWADNGYGEYAAGEVWGTIDGVDVSNMSEAVTIEQEGLVAYVYALLEGSDGNIYNLTAGGMALADPSQGGEGEEDDTKLTVNDADIAPGLVNTSDLELYGSTSDWKEINVVLKNGTTKLYGDYTAEELEIKVNWEEATLATGTVASYYELEGVAVFEATVLLGEKTYELTISGTPWVDPSTIVPTETIELEFANAEIKYQYGGLNITAANGDASLGLKINTTADAMYGSFTFDDLFQFASSVVVGDDEISFIYGTVVVEKVKEGEYTYDKVTTSLLGANHKLYNMVATTTPKSTPTGLDNIDTTVAPAKVINNGQLIIIKSGVQYNAQGAIVK